MQLDLGALDEKTLTAAATEYEERGFLLVKGAEDVAGHLAAQLAGRIGADGSTLDEMLDPDKPVVFPRELRERLAKIDTSRELAVSLLETLEPLLRQLIGPLVHVSSSFHGQFKGGVTTDVDHGGYAPKTDYMEVHGAYLLHQDFAGATIPTSPSAVTLWVPLNTCADWNLRVYPGSHRHGLLSSDWMRLDDPRLSSMGEPVDIQAERGTAVVFNAMLLHSTANPGPRRRVSADIRFFPLCAFLPSEVHLLGKNPLGTIRDRLAEVTTPTLRAPLLEDRVFLGGKASDGSVPQHSVLNWVGYIESVARGDGDGALSHLDRFANQEFDPSGPATYASRFHGRPLAVDMLRKVREHLSKRTPNAPELSEIDALIGRLAT